MQQWKDAVVTVATSHTVTAVWDTKQSRYKIGAFTMGKHGSDYMDLVKLIALNNKVEWKGNRKRNRKTETEKEQSEGIKRESHSKETAAMIATYERTSTWTVMVGGKWLSSNLTLYTKSQGRIEAAGYATQINSSEGETESDHLEHRNRTKAHCS